MQDKIFSANFNKKKLRQLVMINFNLIYFKEIFQPIQKLVRKTFLKNPEGRRLLGGTKRRWKDNYKTMLWWHTVPEHWTTALIITTQNSFAPN